MSKVFVDVGMTIDGYMAGPNARPENPMGDGAVRMHDWLFQTRSFCEHLKLPGGEVNADDALVRATFDRIGANVMGRRMFDEGEVAWPEEAPFHCPVFVLTHHAREPWVRPGGTTFHFVTEGFDVAFARAREAAGNRDVRISGGANAIQQAFRAGVVEELTVHLSPLMLSGGVRLFEAAAMGRVRLEPVEVIPSETVTHLRYRVAR